jgi:hypothetical protein
MEGKMKQYKFAALAVALAASTTLSSTARADCLQDYVNLPPAEVTFARRVAPTLAATFKAPPAGWGKYGLSARYVNESVGYCEGLEDRPKSPRAEMKAWATYKPLSATHKGYRIIITANDAASPKSGTSAASVVLGSLTKMPRNRVSGIRITFAALDPGPIPEEELIVLKGLFDTAALQALIAGKVPTQEEADALYAQNEAETKTIMAAVKPAKKPARSNGNGKGNSESGSTPAPRSIPPVVPSILRGRLPFPF